MDAASTTNSSLTERDDPTELYKQSGLAIKHAKQHTPTGFLVQGDLLIDYIPTPPPKRPRMSWIWRNNHGEALTYKVTGKGVWLCRHYYEKPQK